MANLSILNKIMKFQKLLLPLNAHNSLLACSSYLASAVVSPQRGPVTTATQFLARQKRRTYSSTKISAAFASASNTSTTVTAAADSIVTSSGSTPIDDFRTREEQREKEYDRQQDAREELEKRTQSKAEDEAKRAKVDAVRTKILEAALAHVPTLGWSREAIVQGAEEAGFPSVVHGMFPEGGFALVSYFYGKCNDELIRRLQVETQNGESKVDDTVDFLVRAVRARLEMIVPYKAQWPQAVALIAMPQNASTALAQLLTLVDDICYYSGDRSVDIGWYTRRIGLATILKMTELFMLQDNSPEHVNTWEFLKNRMDEAVQLQMVLSQTGDITHQFQRSFNSAFITARNILGIGYNRR